MAKRIFGFTADEWGAIYWILGMIGGTLLVLWLRGQGFL